MQQETLHPVSDVSDVDQPLPAQEVGVVDPQELQQIADKTAIEVLLQTAGVVAVNEGNRSGSGGTDSPVME